MPIFNSSNERGDRTERRDIRQTSSRRLRYIYLRFLRMRGTPAEIARGLSVGVFAGMYPFFGFQTILAVAIAALLKGNKLAAAAGTWVSNPLTYIPIYAFNFQVGRFLLRSNVTFAFTNQSLHQILQTGADLAWVMLVGSTAVGSIVAALAYAGAMPIVRRFRRQMRSRRQNKLAKSIRS